MESLGNKIIAKISKGSNMNQIYLPKNSRSGMLPGEYVMINLLTDSTQKQNEQKIEFKPYFYGLKNIEPIKLEIIEKIFIILGRFIENVDNIIVTGSFLDKGFNFKDIDLIILEKKVKSPMNEIEKDITEKIGLKSHILALSPEEFISGLASDPLYQTMISRCISKNRLIFKFKPLINAKLLDLHLLKSKALLDNFDILTGKEKYYLTFNMISIILFLKQVKVTKELVESTIKQELNIKNLEEIKENLVKKDFLIKYKNIYNKTFDLIMKELKNGPK